MADFLAMNGVIWICVCFFNEGDPQVTIGFDNKMVIHDLDDARGYPPEGQGYLQSDGLCYDSPFPLENHHIFPYTLW
jgi:hypothetical protein